MLHRRAFLSLLAAGAAGVALDPERALWVPGRKTIFLPTPRQVVMAQKELGISIRFVQQFPDGPLRFDILYGIGNLQREFNRLNSARAETITLRTRP